MAMILDHEKGGSNEIIEGVRRPTMKRSCLKTPMLACMLMTSPACATEELSVEKLVVQAQVLRLVDSMEFGFGLLWMMSRGTLVRVDPSSNEVTDVRIDGVRHSSMMAIGEGAVWVADVKSGIIFKVAPNDYAVMKEIRAQKPLTEGSIAVGEGAIWVVSGEELENTLTRFNARSGLMEAKITLPSTSASMVFDFGSV
jgi:virginiamycin B lyase